MSGYTETAMQSHRQLHARRPQSLSGHTPTPAEHKFTPFSIVLANIWAVCQAAMQ